MKASGTMHRANLTGAVLTQDGRVLIGPPTAAISPRGVSRTALAIESGR